MKQLFSAGGIVFKKEQGDYFIIVAQHSGHHGWIFPKGIIGDAIANETKEQTALREVQEETGVVGRIMQPLKSVTYWYVQDKERVKKTVYYFLMEYVSGDIAKHDWEMEKVEWLSIDDVENRLTYNADKQVWKEARSLILSEQHKT